MLKPKAGEFFYLVRDNIKTLHKITSIGKRYLDKETKKYYNAFEWGILGKSPFGWGIIQELKLNSNKKSKVKWIKEE